VITHGVAKMRIGTTTLAAIAAILSVVSSAPARADAAFDAKKFWERLDAERRSSSGAFDAKAFFEKLDAERRSYNKPLDARSVLARLEAEGVKMPSEFDARKFFEKLDAERRSVPNSIDITMIDPTIEECRSGWQPNSRWGEPLFNQTCSAKR
jgi:hypothetical protein